MNKSSTLNASVSSSTSSESSEDEEEARRIREAICDESIFRSAGLSFAGVKTSNQTQKQSPVPDKPQKAALKSNRPQDKNDGGNDSILHTTPEFRVHVAKQLSQMLDKKLADSFSDKVWRLPKLKISKVETGIRLFSDSKLLCKIRENPEGSEVNDGNKISSVRPKKLKKHKLSSSSEDSSDDEKIKACVFSLSDINQENERLAFLENPATNTMSGLIFESGTNNGNGSPKVLPSYKDETKEHGKVKKKKKRKKENHNTQSEESR